MNKFTKYQEGGRGRRIDVAKNNGGYTWLANSYLDEYLTRISPLVTCVYLVLARNSPGRKEFEPITESLSAADIGKKLNRSRGSIQTALKKLVNIGVIEKIGKLGYPSRFRLLETCLKNSTPVEEIKHEYPKNTTPPEQKTILGDGAEPYETKAYDPPKSFNSFNSLRGNERKIKMKQEKNTGIRPVKKPLGCGPRKV